MASLKSDLFLLQCCFIPQDGSSSIVKIPFCPLIQLDFFCAFLFFFTLKLNTAYTNKFPCFSSQIWVKKLNITKAMQKHWVSKGPPPFVLLEMRASSDLIKWFSYSDTVVCQQMPAVMGWCWAKTAVAPADLHNYLCSTLFFHDFFLQKGKF